VPQCPTTGPIYFDFSATNIFNTRLFDWGWSNTNWPYPDGWHGWNSICRVYSWKARLRSHHQLDLEWVPKKHI
jgi:hypothetical protein